MKQEFLELAKLIDDNEDAINDALEADDFDTASELANEKVQLFAKLRDIALQIEDKESIDEYLKSLYAATKEQLDILEAEHENMRQEIVKIRRGGKGNHAYQRVRAYALNRF